MKDNGIPVVWGVGSTSTISAFGTAELQGRDYNRKADKFELKDENGEVVGRKDYNYTEKCTFRYIPTAASGSSVTPTLPAIGDSFSVTDSTITQIAGGLWIVEDASFKSTNDSALVADVEAIRYAGISS